MSCNCSSRIFRNSSRWHVISCPPSLFRDFELVSRKGYPSYAWHSQASKWEAKAAQNLSGNGEHRTKLKNFLTNGSASTNRFLLYPDSRKKRVWEAWIAFLVSPSLDEEELAKEQLRRQQHGAAFERARRHLPSLRRRCPSRSTRAFSTCASGHNSMS